MMGQNTKIEWAHHTFNPWRGCTKVSAGCKHCYAEKMSGRNPAVLGTWGKTGHRAIAAESYWKLPEQWHRSAKASGQRPRVFCASLADIFEGYEEMPEASRSPVKEARRRLFKIIQRTPDLDWLLLTKRPLNVMPLIHEAIDTSDDPEYDFNAAGEPNALDIAPLHELYPNLWIGASVENQEATARIDTLRTIEAAVLFLSIEPLLGPISADLSGIDWVIVGGESGPGARPMHPDWARSVRDQSKAAGAAFFFKQWGEWKPITEFKDGATELYAPRRLAEPDEDQSAINEIYGRRCTVDTTAVRYDGETGRLQYTSIDGHLAYQTFRVGKKAAGRELDGRTWDELPKLHYVKNV